MAIVPAVVSGVFGYLTEILSGSGSHKTTLIRESSTPSIDAVSVSAGHDNKINLSLDGL